MSTRLSDRQIDALLLKEASPRRSRKVATLAAQVVIYYGDKYKKRTNRDRQNEYADINRRMVALIRLGAFETFGDISQWRYSEVRLTSTGVTLQKRITVGLGEKRYKQPHKGFSPRPRSHWQYERARKKYEAEKLARKT